MTGDCAPPNSRRKESEPPKSRSETVWTSAVDPCDEATYPVTSSMLRCEKYGSECGWRLSSPQMPAYAMTVMPLPGSTDAAPPLPPHDPFWPLNVWSASNWWPISCAT